MKKLWSAIRKRLQLSSKTTVSPRHDVAKFEALRTHINTTGKRVVSVELFFDGNWDAASIGCNLINHPGIRTFYEILKYAEARDDVEQVWMGITNWADSDYLNEWPFCDTVLFIGTIDSATLWEILAPLHPEHPIQDSSQRSDDHFPEGRFAGLPSIQSGQHLLWAWWD